MPGLRLLDLHAIGAGPAPGGELEAGALYRAPMPPCSTSKSENVGGWNRGWWARKSAIKR